MDTLQDVFKGSSSKDVDYIQYAVYLPPKSTETETVVYLQDTLAMINSFIQPLIKDYIWQKDRFHLSLTYDTNKDPTYPFLFGISRFGDCVNDEWFIVYLLKSISLQVPEAVISLSDNDGDVLLIEAALELPSWLDPSNSENRVYLHGGKVHIIPLPTSPADILQVPTGQLLREKAIDIVRQRQPLATKRIQETIEQRICTYPNTEEIHRAKCLLPTKAAFVLLSEPQLITLAVEAFYLRDPISMKACASMKVFSPIDNVETVIRFTKTTYAQTVSQKFYAPKPFRLPSMKEKKQYKYAELGMKIACGLEMLYHITNDNKEEDINYDFEKDLKFKSFINHLTKLGYFKSERNGSKLYKLLESKAKEQYLQFKKQENNEKHIVTLNDLDVNDIDLFKGSDAILSNNTNLIKARIDELLSQYTEEGLNQLLKENKDKEESDEWMNVDPQQLEELLMKRMGHMNENMMNDLKQDFSQEENIDLESIMSNLENFVENRKSGIEGVEINSEDEDYSEEEEYNEPIQFDINKFMSILTGESTKEEEEKEEKESLSYLMEEMDQEIYSHDKINKSFTKLSINKEEEEEDENAPVDVQLNLVKNVLDSFKSQQGLPGPVGNLLNQFGFILPADNEQEE